MKRLWIWMLSGCMVLLAACGSIGVVTPKSAEEQYVYAVATNAAVRTAAADAVRSGKLSKADGAKVLQVTDTARRLLDESLSVAQADRLTRITEAIDLLKTLVAELKAYGVEVPGV